MTVLHHIERSVAQWPDKVAIITSDGVITYRELYAAMLHAAPLPIPLLGKSWDGDFILHTTGTTGHSKGVVISQTAVIANSENLIHGQRFSHNLVFIIAGTMEHLGCWSKIFPVLMTGGTLLILKDGLKDINAFYAAMDINLEAYGLPADTKFATFLVPANIRILLQFSKARLATYADKIDFIETGAAPMPQSDMETLCHILPQSRLYNTFASTETGIVATHNYNAPGACIAGCLGRPLPHSSITISDEGKITCSGKTLMTEYLAEPELTRQVLHDGALHTNDKGIIDDSGRLHILGRDDDIINVGGYKLNPLEVEEQALSMPDVKDCICISMPHPILGNAPVLLVVLNEGYELNKRHLAQSLHARLEQYKVPVNYIAVPSVKRTFNGKLDRKHYRNPQNN